MPLEINEHTYQAILQGDSKAYEPVVRAYQGMVRAVITARLHDAVEAYDLTQQVFIIAYRKWGEYDHNRSLRPWLLGIAIKLVLRHHEKRRAIAVGGEDEVRALLDKQMEEADESWQDASMLDALEICMGKLEEAARDLIRRRYFDDQPISELREELGLKHSAVTMKLHRIRQQLQICIERNLSAAPS